METLIRELGSFNASVQIQQDLFLEAQTGNGQLDGLRIHFDSSQWRPFVDAYGKIGCLWASCGVALKSIAKLATAVRVADLRLPELPALAEGLNPVGFDSFYLFTFSP